MTNGGSELKVMQSIVFLTVDVLPVKGYEIEDSIRIGNDAPTAGAFAQKEFAETAGTLDAFQLEHNPTYAYVASRFTSGTMDEATGLAYLRAFVVKVQTLLLALWMIKDNSANALTAYYRLDDADGPHFISEDFTTYFFTADCELRTTHFTAVEWERAIAFLRQLDAAIPKLPQNERRVSGLIHESRLARTLYTLQAARNTSDLLVKIAFYCMCLEALFSTDKEGITYRIAERTALFLGNDGPERRAILEDVTKLYATRSKVVHGDLVKKTQLPDLLERVKRGDDYLRRCLTKIMADNALLHLFTKKPSEAIVEHFKAQVFDH